MRLNSTADSARARRYTIVTIALAAAFLLSGVYLAAPAPSPVPAATADPVCGFTVGPHFYYDAKQVRQGLGVDLVSGEEQVGQPVTLRLLVHQKPRNFPVDRLQLEHG